MKYYLKEMKHLGFDFLSLKWTVPVTIAPGLLHHNLSGLAQEYARTPATQIKEKGRGVLRKTASLWLASRGNCKAGGSPSEQNPEELLNMMISWPEVAGVSGSWYLAHVTS